MNVGIILAAGKTDTMGASVDRAFLNLGSRPMLAYSIEAFEQCAEINQVVVVVNKDRIEAAQAVCRMFGCSKLLDVIAGGARRQQSLLNALNILQDDDYKLVTIHEVSRPCVHYADIAQTIKSAKRYGSGVCAESVHGRIKYCERGRRVTESLDSSKLWLSMYPQSYDLALLRKGLAAAKKKKLSGSDESEAVELVSKDVRIVEPERPGIRIATVDDLALAAGLLKLA